MVVENAQKRRSKAILENGQSYTGNSKIKPRNSGSKAEERPSAVKRQKHDK